jgi:hypothetical protein
LYLREGWRGSVISGRLKQTSWWAGMGGYAVYF